MKRSVNMKYLFVLLAVLCLAVLPRAFAGTESEVVFFADSSIYTVAGEDVISDVVCYIKEGRLMVPVAYVGPALGTEKAVWLANDRIVQIKKDSDVIYLYVDEQKILRNGEEIIPDVGAEILDIGNGGGRTMLPISWVAKLLEESCEWYPSVRSVHFYNSEAVYGSPGVFGPDSGTEHVFGNVIVDTDQGIALQNMEIHGNLIISEKVGSGDVRLDNVSVVNRTFVRGGGADSIHIDGGRFGEVYIQKTIFGDIRVEAVNVDGVRVFVSEHAADEKIILTGDFGEVFLEVPDSYVLIKSGSSVGSAVVGEKAERSRIVMETGSAIEEMKVFAGVTIEGPGSIGNLEVCAGNVLVSRKTNVGNNPDVSWIPSSSGSSSGGSSSSEDTVSPDIVLTGPVSSEVNAPALFTAEFSEAVEDFDFGDISVTNGTVSGFAQTGDADYGFLVTPVSDGDVSVSIPAGICTDEAGNPNTAGNTVNFSYDSTDPVTVISTTASDPTDISPIPFTVDFTEEVTGFTIEDIDVSNGTAGSFAGSGSVYTFEVVPMSQDSVKIIIAPGLCHDSAGNGNTGDSFSVRYEVDSTPPGVVISTSSSSPTSEQPIGYEAAFTESVTGFGSEDISVTNGTVTGFTATDAAHYDFLVTPESDGDVSAGISAGVCTDEAGNPNTEGSSVTVSYQTVPSVVSFTAVQSAVLSDTIECEIEFSEPVWGFYASVPVVTNGYTYTLTGTSGDSSYQFGVRGEETGDVTITVPSGKCYDSDNNFNTASDTLTLAYVDTHPEPVIATTASDPTSESPVPCTVAFTERVYNFAVEDITVVNGTAGDFALISSAPYTYGFNVTPSAAGDVSVSIPAGVCIDREKNNNTASNTLTVTYEEAVDNTPPSFAEGYPKSSNVLSHSFDLLVKLDEACTVDFQVWTKIDDTQVVTGTFDVGAADTEYSTTVDSKLTAGTPYEVYLTAEDSAGNRQLSWAKVELVETAEGTPAPALADGFAFSDPAGSENNSMTQIALGSVGIGNSCYCKTGSYSFCTDDYVDTVSEGWMQVSSGDLISANNGDFITVIELDGGSTVVRSSGDSAVVVNEAAAVTGTVTDNHGNPVGGATVTTTDGQYSATTGSDGKYSLALPDGSWYIDIYKDFYFNNHGLYGPVSSGETVDAVLTEGAVLTGTVFTPEGIGAQLPHSLKVGYLEGSGYADVAVGPDGTYRMRVPAGVLSVYAYDLYQELGAYVGTPVSVLTAPLNQYPVNLTMTAGV